jgi:hypothetical protein
MINRIPRKLECRQRDQKTNADDGLNIATWKRKYVWVNCPSLRRLLQAAGYAGGL